MYDLFRTGAIILFLTAIFTMMSSAGARVFQDQAAFYIEKYGRADSATPLNQRVLQVFERLRAVADKNQQRWPHLVIVQHTLDPLALALPDGAIILSQQAIQNSYQDVTPALGDSRIAFILGHELAHLANNHFWHQEVMQFAENTALKSAITIDKSLRQQQELAADDAGFLYAALAGYPVDQLLNDTQHVNHFFSQWEQQTVRTLATTHPEIAIRVNLLQERLQALLKQIPFFHFGVRLSHFHRCEDALYFFKAFQQIFPAREVFNNLAVCYLQLARQELGSAAWDYWLPLQLAVTSLADSFQPALKISRSAQSPVVVHYLTQAHHLLTQATQADPYYVPGWVNLAISAWYQNEIFAARAAIEKAYQLAPKDAAVQGLRALIIQAEGLGADTWSQAVTLLQALTQNANAEPIWLYNIAQLLTQRGRTAALPYWERLAKQAQVLPSPVRQQVCAQVSCPTQKAPELELEAELPWTLPVSVGTYIKRSPPTQQVLSKWHRLSFDWQKAVYGTIYQAPDRSTAVLELAGYAEMVVLYQPNIAVETLAEKCSLPLQNQAVVSGKIVHCQHWSALIQEQAVQELWVVAH